MLEKYKTEIKFLFIAPMIGYFTAFIFVIIVDGQFFRSIFPTPNPVPNSFMAIMAACVTGQICLSYLHKAQKKKILE